MFRRSVLLGLTVLLAACSSSASDSPSSGGTRGRPPSSRATSATPSGGESSDQDSSPALQDLSALLYQPWHRTSDTKSGVSFALPTAAHEVNRNEQGFPARLYQSGGSDAYGSELTFIDLPTTRAVDYLLAHYPELIAKQFSQAGAKTTTPDEHSLSDHGHPAREFRIRFRVVSSEQIEVWWMRVVGLGTTLLLEQTITTHPR